MERSNNVNKNIDKFLSMFSIEFSFKTEPKYLFISPKLCLGFNENSLYTQWLKFSIKQKNEM